MLHERAEHRAVVLPRAAERVRGGCVEQRAVVGGEVELERLVALEGGFLQQALAEAVDGHHRRLVELVERALQPLDARGSVPGETLEERVRIAARGAGLQGATDACP